ncbi:MAG: hypothetical protein ACSI46_00645 [Gloeotrichia echinulata DVL01]
MRNTRRSILAENAIATVRLRQKIQVNLVYVETWSFELCLVSFRRRKQAPKFGKQL